MFVKEIIHKKRDVKQDNKLVDIYNEAEKLAASLNGHYIIHPNTLPFQYTSTKGREDILVPCQPALFPSIQL